jgi:hypothetical protein
VTVVLNALLFTLTVPPVIGVSLQVTDRDPNFSCAASAVVVATWCNDDGCSEETLSPPVRLNPGRVGHRLQVVARAEGCWSETLEVTSQTESPSEALTIGLWPVARVGGAFENGHDLVDSVILAEINASQLPGTRSFECTLDAGKWSCEIPALSDMDLKLIPGGYAPEYFLGIAAESGEHVVLPTRILRPGSSIAGTIVDERGYPIIGANVLLLPEGRHAAGVPPASIVMATAVSGPKGFFQLAGLSAGTYALRSEREGFSPNVVRLIEVGEGVERYLPPVTQLPLQRLEVWVDPPATIEGARWAIRLERLTPFTNHMEPMSRGVADAAGLWEAGELEAGEYHLRVSDPEGNTRREQIVRLDQVLNRVAVSLHGIKVSGRVRLAMKPLEARVVFRRGGEEVAMDSGEDGRFAGHLPGEGVYVAMIEPRFQREGQFAYIRQSTRVSVTAESDAEIDIRLPGGRVAGEVVDGQGNRVAAHVHAVRNDRPESQVFTEDGTFELVGLEEGEVLIVATADRIKSEPARVSVSYDDVVETRLVIDGERKIRARVVDENGRPLPGVIVRIGSASVVGVREVVSDLMGSIRFPVPSGTRSLFGVALTPMRPIELFDVDLLDSRDYFEVRLSAIGGWLTLRLRSAPPWPSLQRGNIRMPVDHLLVQGGRYGDLPSGWSADGLRMHLTPGEYTICDSRTSPSCSTIGVYPMAEQHVDLTE